MGLSDVESGKVMCKNQPYAYYLTYQQVLIHKICSIHRYVSVASATNRQGVIQEHKHSNIYPTRCNVTQFILFGNCSTRFGWYHHPSSGAQTTVSTASGICSTVTTTCRYSGGSSDGVNKYRML